MKCPGSNQLQLLHKFDADLDLLLKYATSTYTSIVVNTPATFTTVVYSLL